MILTTGRQISPLSSFNWAKLPCVKYFMGNISLHMHISLNSHNFPLREVLLFLFPTYRWENQTQWKLRISLKPDKPQMSEAMCSWAQNFPLYHAYFFLLFSLLFVPPFLKISQPMSGFGMGHTQEQLFFPISVAFICIETLVRFCLFDIRSFIILSLSLII